MLTPRINIYILYAGHDEPQMQKNAFCAANIKKWINSYSSIIYVGAKGKGCLKQSFVAKGKGWVEVMTHRGALLTYITSKK